MSLNFSQVSEDLPVAPGGEGHAAPEAAEEQHTRRPIDVTTIDLTTSSISSSSNSSSSSSSSSSN
eukprot:3880338-Heterocapsa_arctica.AAC.1